MAAINKNYSAPRYTASMQRQKGWELLRIAAFYLILFWMLVMNVYFYAFLGRQIVIIAVFLMILSAMVSYCICLTERPNMVTGMKRNLFIYLGTLLLAYFAVSIMNNIDANQMGVSLGLNAGQTQNNAAQGWIVMMLQFAMIGIPFAFISYEVKRIWTCYGFGFGRVTKRKRMEQLQKNIVR